MGLPPFGPHFPDSHEPARITVPKSYSEALGWDTGKDPLLVWLLLLTPGRFRLLSDADVEGDDKLSQIRSDIVQGPKGRDLGPTEYVSGEIATIIGRLIPTSLKPGRPCRLILPKDLPLLDQKTSLKDVPAPEQNSRRFVLLFSSGYLELWLREVYASALRVPTSSVI